MAEDFFSYYIFLYEYTHTQYAHFGVTDVQPCGSERLVGKAADSRVRLLSYDAEIYALALHDFHHLKLPVTTS